MRDFDDMAELWRRQSLAPPAPDHAERAREVERQIRLAVTQRAQNAFSAVGLLILTLVGFQVFGTVHLIGSATEPGPLTRLHFVLFQGVYAALLLYFAYRLVVRESIHPSDDPDLRGSLELTLREINAALRDLRIAAWVDPSLFVLLPLISMVNARWAGAVTTASLLGRGLPLVLSHVVAWIFAWRYYHTVLRRRSHLKSLLAEITAESE